MQNIVPDAKSVYTYQTINEGRYTFILFFATRAEVIQLLIAAAITFITSNSYQVTGLFGSETVFEIELFHVIIGLHAFFILLDRFNTVDPVNPYTSVNWIIIGSDDVCWPFGAKPLSTAMMVYC